MIMITRMRWFISVSLFCQTYSIVHPIFFLTTALDTTKRPTAYITVSTKPGNTDKMYHELDKARANDGLVRTALTVLQNSVHNITMETNNLNLDVINHKQKINQLESKVSRWSTVIKTFDPHLLLRGIQSNPLHWSCAQYNIARVQRHPTINWIRRDEEFLRCT